MSLVLLLDAAPSSSPVTTANLTYEWVAKLAKSGTSPGNNTDPTTTFVANVGSNDITLQNTGGNFGWTGSSGWSGSGTRDDPYCLVADGTGDYGTLASALVSSDADFSIELWTYMASGPPSVNSSFLYAQSGGTYQGHRYYVATGGSATWSMGNGASYTYVTNSNNDGYGAAWQHHVLTYNASTNAATPYDNAATEGPDTTAFAPNTTSTRRLFHSDSGMNAMKVATCRVYSSCLSSGEIEANYAAGPTAASTDTTVPVTASLTPTYSIRSAVAQTLTPTYDVRNTVAQTLTPTYNVGFRTNYITNPSIETATTGWYRTDNCPAGNSAIARVAGGSVGSYELQFSYTAGTGDSNHYATQYSNYSGDGTAAQGQTWTVSADIKLGSGTTSGVTVSLRIPYYDVDETYINVLSGSDISASLTTSFQRFSYTGTLPAGASISQVGGYLHVGSITDGDAFDLRSDAWLLEKVGAADDYFDGDTTDADDWVYAWTGTSHASTSTATHVETTAVAQTLTPTYNVRNAIPQTLTPTYNVRNAIAQTLTPTYAIRNVVAQTLTPTYGLRNVVAKTLTPTYNIIVHISQSLTPTYNIISHVSQTLSPTYNIIAHVSQTLTPTYNIISHISQTLTPTYNIIVHVAQSLTPVYGIRNTAAQTLTPTYDIAELVAQTLVAVYDIEALVAEWITSMILDTGESRTDLVTIPVTLYAASSSGTVTDMCWSEDGVTYGEWETYDTSTTYTFATEDQEEKTVYVVFRDDNLETSPATEESIELVALTYPGAYTVINAA